MSDLLSIGTVDELNKLAASGLAPQQRPKVNSHVHLPPNFCAFDNVRQAVDQAAAEGAGVVGLSNYYDFAVYAEFTAMAKKHGIFPLFGLEIIVMDDSLVKAGIKVNDPGNPGKMYLCGKGITRWQPMSPKAAELMGLIRKNDSTRMAVMAGKIAAVFEKHGVKTGLDDKSIIDRVMKRHGCPREAVYLQERHLAMAFQETFFALVPATQRIAKMTEIFGAAPKAGTDDAVKVQNEIRSHLMKAGKVGFVEESFLNFEQAWQLILELGGIPCYPTLADGASPICGYETPVDKLIVQIQSRGITCAEFIPIRNKPEVLAEYVLAMRKAGLVITAGTEHNTLDRLPIEPACLAGVPVREDLKAIFWEGACVVAAHQFLTAAGQCGYVDAQGNPNPAYKGTEERIAAFRRLGAAVIQRYYERQKN